MKASRAAREIVDGRLQAVESYLRELADAESPTPAQVHRLRVATRRADAALRSFRPLLRRKRLRDIRQRLRRYRRGAADARRADVQAAYVRKALTTSCGARAEALERVLKVLERRRAEALKQLSRVVRKQPAKRLRRSRKKLLAKLKSDKSDRSFAEVGMHVVTGLVDRIDTARGSQRGVIEDLHALRLQGKRLRYALEIFSPCFHSGMDEAYEAVRGVQDELGAINDLHEHAHLIETFIGRHPDLPADVSAAAADVVEEWLRDRDERACAFVARWQGAEPLVGHLLAARRDAPVVGVLPAERGEPDRESVVEPAP